MEKEGKRESTITSLLDGREWRLNEVRSFWAETQENDQFDPISYPSFVKMIRKTGLSLKRVATRDRETFEIKRARVWFCVEYAALLRQDNTHVVYFDCS